MSLLSDVPNVSLIEPLDYLSLVHLMQRSALVLTDSGGIQEEAPAFQIPVLVMRDTTERPEGLTTGFVTLVGTDRQRIVETAAGILSEPPRSTLGTRAPSPYGDGKAAGRIVSVLLERANRAGRASQAAESPSANDLLMSADIHAAGSAR